MMLAPLVRPGRARGPDPPRRRRGIARRLSHGRHLPARDAAGRNRRDGRRGRRRLAFGASLIQPFPVITRASKNRTHDLKRSIDRRRGRANLPRRTLLPCNRIRLLPRTRDLSNKVAIDRFQRLSTEVLIQPPQVGFVVAECRLFGLFIQPSNNGLVPRVAWPDAQSLLVPHSNPDAIMKLLRPYSTGSPSALLYSSTLRLGRNLRVADSTFSRRAVRPGFPLRVIANRDLVLRPYQPLFFEKAATTVEVGLLDAGDSSRSAVLSVQRIDGGFEIRNCGSRPQRTLYSANISWDEVETRWRDLC